MAGAPATHSPVQFTFLGTTKQSNWQNWQKRSSSKKNCEDRKPLLILVSLCLRHCWLWISQSQILRPAGTEMNKVGNLLTNFLQVLNSCSLCYLHPSVYRNDSRSKWPFDYDSSHYSSDYTVSDLWPYR